MTEKDARVGDSQYHRPFATAPDNEAVPPAHVVSFAIEVSTWSPCRSKRGVVLFAGADIIAHGYNYKPRGFECTQDAACKATCRVEAIHAEQAALLHAGRGAEHADLVHIKSVNGQPVPSGGPSCVECSKLIRACGVAGVWLLHDDGWRRYQAVEFHAASLLSGRNG